LRGKFLIPKIWRVYIWKNPNTFISLLIKKPILFLFSYRATPSISLFLTDPCLLTAQSNLLTAVDKDEAFDNETWTLTTTN